MSASSHVSIWSWRAVAPLSSKIYLLRTSEVGNSYRSLRVGISCRQLFEGRRVKATAIVIKKTECAALETVTVGQLAAEFDVSEHPQRLSLIHI